MLASKRFTRNEDRRNVLRRLACELPENCQGTNWQNKISSSSDCARTPFAKMDAPEVTSGISLRITVVDIGRPNPRQQRRDGERLETSGDMFRLLHLDGNGRQSAGGAIVQADRQQAASGLQPISQRGLMAGKPVCRAWSQNQDIAMGHGR